MNPDKAKPSVRRGRKAAGFLVKMAKLLKDEKVSEGVKKGGILQ